MSAAYPTGWYLWVDWQARSDWTVADGADRLAASLRLVHQTWPVNTDAFKASATAKQALPVDDADLAKRLAPKLKASRNRNMFADNDLFGDATAYLTPATRAGLAVTVGQVATGAGWSSGEFQVRLGQSLAPSLGERPGDIITAMAELAAVWQARNAWIDMTHVRQQWNHRKRDVPVYGWATWLHPDYATVDTTGLDVDVSDAAGGGKLIVLRVDPAAMADSGREVGKDVVRQLAARTVLADGRPLLAANERLREAMSAEAVQ